MARRLVVVSSAAVLLLASCASMPIQAPGRGATIEVRLRDGRTMAGELIAIRAGTIVILDAKGRDGSAALAECRSVVLRTFTRGAPGAAIGAGKGLLYAGSAGFLLGALTPGHFGIPLETGLMVGGILGAIGAVYGALKGGYDGVPRSRDVIDFPSDGTGIESAVERLRKASRFPTER